MRIFLFKFVIAFFLVSVVMALFLAMICGIVWAMTLLNPITLAGFLLLFIVVVISVVLAAGAPLDLN